MALFVKLPNKVFNNSGLPAVGELKTVPIGIGDSLSVLHYILGTGLPVEDVSGRGRKTIDKYVQLQDRGALLFKDSYIITDKTIPANQFSVMIAITERSNLSASVLSNDDLGSGFTINYDETDELRFSVRGGVTIRLNLTVIPKNEPIVIFFRLNGSYAEAKILNKNIESSDSQNYVSTGTQVIYIGSVSHQFKSEGKTMIPEVVIYDQYLDDEEMSDRYLKMKSRLEARGIIVG